MLSWLTDRCRQQGTLGRYPDLVFPAASAAQNGLRVKFFGVSTLLFSDGKTSILIDGFFTRPGKFRLLLTRISPDPALISKRLRDAGIDELAAVIVVHSHFDHALDAPVVVKQIRNAKLIGSESTAYIARNYHLPKNRICVDNGQEWSFGQFKVRLLPTPHSPIPWLLRMGIPKVLFDGPIRPPLELPAHMSRYRHGGSYSVLIEHGSRRILIQASGGFERGALKEHHAQVVFLGIGQLGRMSEQYRRDYWREVVEAVDAKRVFPIHWDDLTVSLDRPLVSIPLIDNFHKTMDFLIKQEHETRIEVRLLPVFESVDPFENLERTT